MSRFVTGLWPRNTEVLGQRAGGAVMVAGAEIHVTCYLVAFTWRRREIQLLVHHKPINLYKYLYRWNAVVRQWLYGS